MGDFKFVPYIEQTEDAAARTLLIDYRRPVTVSVVGTLDPADSIAIEIPVNADPNPDTDAHWQTLTIDGEDQVLDADNLARAIPYSLLVRIKKPATAGREIGIRVM